MKGLVLFIVALVAIGAAYFVIGGFVSYDPVKEGEEALAAVKPGMTWQQVIDTVGEPKRGQLMRQDDEGYVVPGGYFDYDAARFKELYDGGRYTHGFIFRYVYSDAMAFDVYFDNAGKVTSAGKLPTLDDLLNH